MDDSRLLSRWAVIPTVGLVLALAACGSDSSPTPTDAARNLMAIYGDAGVTVPDSERECANRKVVGALSDEDASAKKLTDLSMEGRAKVAAAIEGCFSASSLKQVFEKTVAKDAGLAPHASACLAKALIDQHVSYADLMRQSKSAVTKLGDAARKCIRTGA